jgi:zinc protease
MYDLPPDYYEGLPARLEALSTSEVYAAAKRHLLPERMVVIAVGDRKTIEPQIAALGLGAIAHRSLEGEAEMTMKKPSVRAR